MQLYITLLMLVGVAISYAEDTRSVNLPPMEASSLAGGKVNGVACVSSGLAGTLDADAPNDGVRYYYHIYRIHLREVSGVSVKVRVGVGKDSSVAGQTTFGTNIGTPTVMVGAHAVSATSWTEWIDLGADSMITVSVVFICQHNSCAIWFDEASPIVGGGPTLTGGNCGTAQDQICGAIQSKFLGTIEVKDIGNGAGAVSATVTTKVHRCNGYQDYIFYKPGVYTYQGGQPF